MTSAHKIFQKHINCHRDIRYLLPCITEIFSAPFFNYEKCTSEQEFH